LVNAFQKYALPAADDSFGLCPLDILYHIAGSSRLVVAIDFLVWTLYARLRHASLVAVSTDKRASEVGCENNQFRGRVRAWSA